MIGALLAALAAPVTTQQPPGTPVDAAQDATPTFRAVARYIEVDVDVRDGDGEFVTGLTRDDFILTEDGIPQAIDRVILVDLPPVRTSLTAESGDTAPGASGITDPSRGRIYVMVADAFDDRVTAIASLFIDRYLDPADLMGIVHARRGTGQPLTSDKRLLHAALEGALRSSPDRPIVSVGEALPERRTLDNEIQVYRTLKDVAVNLGAVTGRRKSILFIGSVPNLWAQREDIHDLWAAHNDAVRTAAALRVPIHSVNPMPLTFPQMASGESAGPPPPRQSDLLEPDRDRDAAIGLLAEDTGGVRVGTRALDSGFGRIVEANRRYYVLGYYSSVERDGQYHRIDVRVSHPGMSVQARRGFRAMSPEVKGKTVDLPPGQSPTVRAALEHGDTTGTLPIEATATLFRGARFDGSVVVDATVQSGGTPFADGEKVRFAAAAYDGWGRRVSAAQRSFSLNLSDDSQARIEQHGLRFTTRMSLPYGTYQIRAVVERGTGLSGASTTAVEVPDFTEGTLFVSDLLVSAAPQSTPLTLLADARLRQALPGAPTAARRFTRDRELAVYAEIHDSRWLLSPELAVRWSVTAQATGSLIAGGEERVVSSDRRAVFRGRVPLRSLAPGSYVFTLDAFTLAGIAAAGRRQLPFEVVAGDPAAVSTPRTPRPGSRFEAVSIFRIRPSCPLFALSNRCEEIVRPPTMVRFLADGTFEATNQTAAGLIAAAYGILDEGDISGGPGWLWTEGYDVVGISGPGATPDTGREMLQALLADRFQLRVRVRPRVVNRVVVRSARPDLPIGIRAASPACSTEAVRPDRVECGITVENFLRSWSTKEAGVLPWDPIVDETGLTRRFGRGLIDVTDREMSIVAMGLTAAVEPRTANTVVIERARRPDED